MYYNEIITCSNWQLTSQNSGSALGIYAKAFSPRVRIAQDPDSEGLNRHLGMLDTKLAGYDAFFTGERVVHEMPEGEEDMDNKVLDKWLKFVDDFHTEILLDAQFWAFLVGYLHQRMV